MKISELRAIINEVLAERSNHEESQDFMTNKEMSALIKTVGEVAHKVDKWDDYTGGDHKNLTDAADHLAKGLDALERHTKQYGIKL